MQLTKTKEKKFLNSDRELTIVDGKYFYKDVDVTPIVKTSGPNFLSIMGRAGGKSFHNYFGKDTSSEGHKERWYRFTGVTSALDYVGDKSNLMQWYANQVVEQFGWSKQEPGEDAATYNQRLDASISKSLATFKDLSTFDKIAYVKKARTAATMFARKTANLGKNVHEQIEIIIKHTVANSNGVITAGLKAENDQVQHFIDWAIKNNVVFKASEMQVHSKKMWVAGTCDIVMEMNGELYIGDIKTTSSIWGRAYFAQCAAYRICLEEMFPNKYTFAGSILIRIGRDGLFNPEDDVHFSPNFVEDSEYFKAGLTVYRQENNLYSK